MCKAHSFDHNIKGTMKCAQDKQMNIMYLIKWYTYSIHRINVYTNRLIKQVKHDKE